MSIENLAVEQAGELYAPEYVEQAARARPAPAKRTLEYLTSPGHVLTIALALGFGFDLLFYGKALGVSVLLFVLTCLAAIFALAKAEGVQPALRNLWIVAPMLFFAGMVAVRANFFLTFLNVTACVLLLAMLAYYFANGKIERLGLFGYPVVLMLTAVNSLALPSPLISAAKEKNKVARSDGVKTLPIGPILRGLMLALPILFVFTILLASADTIFAEYLSKVFNLDIFNNTPELLWRLAIGLGVAWLVAGGLAYTLRRRGASDSVIGLTSEAEPAGMPPGRIIGAIEAQTVLIAVNLLFFAFVAIQFAYMFAGRTLTTLEDSNYKHYARRGFGELVAVSVLTLGMILVLRWLARLDTSRQMRLFNMLGTLMVGLSLVILTSAWLRMFYWEEVSDYIATELRLYVRVFIVWLAFTYLWLLVSLWVRPVLFAFGAFIAAMGFVGTLDMINPDADVARFNVERAAVRELYVPYLSGLSDDAVPALVAALTLDTIPESQRLELQGSLRRRLSRMTNDSSWQNWQSFNLSRSQAYDLLKEKLK